QRHAGGAAPDAILFNCGVFQPLALRQHVVNVLSSWYSTPGQAWSPLVLTNPSLDLAVAWGAAYYGWLRHIGGKRIGGGIARSYYVGIEVSAAERGGEGEKGRKGEGETEGQSGSPSPPLPLSPSLAVLCVVPQRLEEGEEVNLPKPELELALGQPVLFPLYTSTVRRDDRPGDLLHVAPEQLLQLPPLHTVLRGGKRSGVKRVPVTLAAKSTEIGTLEIGRAHV